MTITIKHTIWGFHVLIVSDDRTLFARAIEALKAIVPKNNRRYFPEGRYWFINKRKEKKLREWIDRVRELSDVQIFEVQPAGNLASIKAA